MPVLKSWLRHLTHASLAATVCVAGCGPEAADEPFIPAMDRPTVSGLSIDEAAISARLDDDSAQVRFELRRTGGAEASGQLHAELRDLETDTVIHRAQAPFSTDGETTAVEVTLTAAEGFPLSAPHRLARYAIDYRVDWAGSALTGHRSLFAAFRLAETQLLTTDAFRVDTPSFIRLMSRLPQTGEALPNLPVTVHLEKGDPDTPVEVPLYTGQTDAQGQIAAPVTIGGEHAGQGQLVVRVETDSGTQELRAPVAVERATKVLVTTDKPLYQPGQVIHLRALALLKPNLTPDAGAPVVFEIHDGKNNKVERIEVVANEYGVAHGKFQLAREVNMGRYRIVATLGETVTEKTVTVERYALPKYDLDITLDHPVYFAGDVIVGTINAQYFFGQPVAAAQVHLTASALDAGETVFADLHGATNDEGLYRFELPVPEYVVGLPIEQGGGLLNLALQVTDTAGQSRTVAKLVRIARGPIEVVVVPEGGTYQQGVEQGLLVRATDAAGRPTVATHEITVNGEALEPIETNEHGFARIVFRAMGPALAIKVHSTSDEGEATRDFTFAAGAVAPDGAVYVRPSKSLYRVGDTLEIDAVVVGAPDSVYVDLVRDGQTILTERVAPNAEGIARLEVPVTPEHVGPLTISAYYLALGSDLRRDSETVYVQSADQLHIEIDPDQAVYAPGEEAVLNVRVTDAQGEGRAAAVGLQGVDEAVYSLMEFRPGLENTYFRIEGELAQPRYQVGVPALATIASDPGAVDDPVRQDEAKMLFSALAEMPVHPIAINTYSDAKAGLGAVVTPFVRAALEPSRSWLEMRMQMEDEPWRFDLHEAVAALAPIYDPWGQRIAVSAGPDFHILGRSYGPDELAGTDDDLEVWAAVYDAPVDRFAEADFDEGAPNAGVPEQAGGGDGGGAGAVRVRRNFPETLFVEPSLITDGQGEAQLRIPLADSITTWRISALANSANGLLGSADQGVRVFQDFFVDIDFPATLTRGDQYSVPVAVYNYLDRPQTVNLEVQEADWFSLVEAPNLQLELAAGEVAGIRLPIRVETVGLHELTIIARGDALQDGVARSILVEPDGQMVEQVRSGSLEENVNVDVQIPEGIVEGSHGLFVKVYPGVFAQVMEGLDGILRMPSGCFEQTSSSTWPNVLVARYLEETDTADPEVMVRAMQYINTGYQRLLTFEVDGGGFEWFGTPPAHTVLTAYGLLEFTDMADVRPVDAEMIARTRAWLLGQQAADGHWTAARGLDETGLLTDPVTITAYVAFALAAAGEDGPPMERAKAYLRNAGPMGTYTTALTANFMVAYQPNDPWTRTLLDGLSTTVESVVEGAAGQHWQTDEQTTTYGRGEAAFIETTALATHALLVARAHPGITEQALAWLVTKKNPHGAWGSTAGTVWTIKCLLASLAGGQDDTADARIRVLLDDQERAAFSVTAENSDVLRQADLTAWMVPGQAHRVSIIKDGTGNLNYGLVQRHYVPWAGPPPGDGPLHIEVAYDRTNLSVDDTVTATVQVSNEDIEYADMVMVDLGIPPGFDVITADLDQLVEQRVFSKYELTQRQLLLYFTEVRPDRPVEFSYRLVARDPIRAQAPRSRVYSYYNPEVETEALPVEFEVQ